MAHTTPGEPVLTRARREQIEQEVNHLGHQGHLARLDGAYEQAYAVGDRELALLAELIAANPGDARTRAVAAAAHGNRAAVLEPLGRVVEAAAAARRSLALYDELSPGEPVRFAPLAADARGRFARLAALAGDVGGARAEGARAVADYRRLAAAATRHEVGLAGALAQYVETLGELGEPGQAWTLTREALDLYRACDVAGRLDAADRADFGMLALLAVRGARPLTRRSATDALRAAEDAETQFTTLLRDGDGVRVHFVEAVCVHAVCGLASIDEADPRRPDAVEDARARLADLRGRRVGWGTGSAATNAAMDASIAELERAIRGADGPPPQRSGGSPWSRLVPRLRGRRSGG